VSGSKKATCPRVRSEQLGAGLDPGRVLRARFFLGVSQHTVRYTEMAPDRFNGGTELVSLPNVSCPRHFSLDDRRSDMRGKALVFGFSFAAVALMCLAREPAAQTQQGTQPSQTERVPPDMLRGDMMDRGMMGGGMDTGVGTVGGGMGGGMMCAHMMGSGMMGGGMGRPDGCRRRRLNFVAGISSRPRADFQRHRSK
jgi:hypothetical protein